VKQNAAAASALARQLSSDEKLRQNLLRASSHAAQATRLARRRFGRLAPVREIVTDQELRDELAEMLQELRNAHTRAGRKRSHRLRNGLLVVAVAGTATAIARSRSTRVKHQPKSSAGQRRADEQPHEEQTEPAERAA
jgi:hypothetical protein